MLNISVLDDEVVFADTLVKRINEYCDKQAIQVCIDKVNSGYDLVENFKKYHLIFLDIEMPSVDGITTAKMINDLKGESEIPFIVFVSSHDEMVFDALKCFPYSFIRKSDVDTDMNVFEIIDKISRMVENSHRTITVRTNRQDVVLKIADIIYIEKYKNYSYIYTKSQRYAVKSSLSYYEEAFSDYGFIRCHDGYIVNLNDISIIHDKSISLINDVSIPMSRSKCKMVKEAFVKRTVCFNVYVEFYKYIWRAVL